MEQRGEIKKFLNLRSVALTRDYFVDRVLKKPNERKNLAATKESLELINEAAQEAADHVKTITKNLPSDAQANTLQKWIDYLEDSARVIWVEVKDQATAYRIFETMKLPRLKIIGRRPSEKLSLLTCFRNQRTKNHLSLAINDGGFGIPWR